MQVGQIEFPAFGQHNGLPVRREGRILRLNVAQFAGCSAIHVHNPNWGLDAALGAIQFVDQQVGPVVRNVRVCTHRDRGMGIEVASPPFTETYCKGFSPCVVK